MNLTPIRQFAPPFRLGAPFAFLGRPRGSWHRLCGPERSCPQILVPAVVGNMRCRTPGGRGNAILPGQDEDSLVTGGKHEVLATVTIHVLSGNLSHQIEHHFYPDIPANRYAAMAVDVRDICARYGQHYNTGSLPRQFGQVVWRSLRHALPSRPSSEAWTRAVAR